MSKGAPRRVLKSVVGPALGASLASLLVAGAIGCNESSDAVRSDEPTRRTAVSVTTAQDTGPFVAAPPSSDIDAGVDAPELPEPGKTSVPKPGIVKPGVAKPGSIPKPGKTKPHPKVGMVMERADEGDEAARPTRPTRRATDPTHHAMGGTPRRLT